MVLGATDQAPAKEAVKGNFSTLQSLTVGETDFELPSPLQHLIPTT